MGPQSADGPRYTIRTPKGPVHSGTWQNNRTPLGVPLSALEVEKNPGNGAVTREAHAAGVRDRTPPI